jgi:hypothetical protein
MTTWMLLEYSDDLLVKLFSHIDLPDFVRLFDLTELATYSAFSPLLVKDDADGKLSRLMRQAPADWPGLMIDSEHTSHALLNHLRHILIVRLNQNVKGMLRYWNPDIARHFFPACTEANLIDWLGPVSRLQWHSTSTPERQILDNPCASTWLEAATTSLLALSAEQQQSINLKIQSPTSSGQES